MTIWNKLVLLLPSRRRAAERDMRDELESLREMAGPAALGNLTLAAEDARGEMGWLWFERFAQDVRYGLRALRRDAHRIAEERRDARSQRDQRPDEEFPPEKPEGQRHRPGDQDVFAPFRMHIRHAPFDGRRAGFGFVDLGHARGLAASPHLHNGGGAHDVPQKQVCPPHLP